MHEVQLEDSEFVQTEHPVEQAVQTPFKEKYPELHTLQNELVNNAGFN
jgi:hypothetical protein